MLRIRERDRLPAQVLVGGRPGNRQIAILHRAGRIDIENPNDRLGQIDLDPNLGWVAHLRRPFAQADSAARDQGEPILSLFIDFDDKGRLRAGLSIARVFLEFLPGPAIAGEPQLDQGDLGRTHFLELIVETDAFAVDQIHAVLANGGRRIAGVLAVFKRLRSKAAR